MRRRNDCYVSWVCFCELLIRNSRISVPGCHVFHPGFNIFRYASSLCFTLQTQCSWWLTYQRLWWCVTVVHETILKRRGVFCVMSWLLKRADVSALLSELIVKCSLSCDTHAADVAWVFFLFYVIWADPSCADASQANASREDATVRMLLLRMPLEVKLQVLVFSNLYVDVSFANVSWDDVFVLIPLELISFELYIWD
jgi:hypothetical protein